MQVKSSDKAAQKLVANASTAGQAYIDGVQNPRRDWGTAAAAAEANFEAGVQQAITRKSFGKGVRRAGSAKQIAGVVSKGAQRFPAGVATGAAAYQAGVEPYFRVLNALALPVRYARRDPRNLERVRAVDTALGQAKEAQGK